MAPSSLHALTPSVSECDLVCREGLYGGDPVKNEAIRVGPKPVLLELLQWRKTGRDRWGLSVMPALRRLCRGIINLRSVGHSSACL